MRTEEYIIILVGVVATDQEIAITYTSDSPKSDVSVQVVYSNGKIIKTFEHIKQATKGVLTLPTEGLFTGSYTCTISEDGQERDSKNFSIK